MKRLAIGTFACFLAAGILWFPGRQERKCLQMLANLDHQINCPGWVIASEEDGTCSNGVWSPKAIHDITPPAFFRCPVAQTNYVLEFRVGTHPFCPSHGRLIEQYGYQPHQPPRSLLMRWLATAACMLLGLSFGVSLVAVVLVKKTKQVRQQTQPTGSCDGGPAA